MKVRILFSIFIIVFCVMEARSQVIKYDYFPDSCELSGTIIMEQYYPYCDSGLFAESDYTINYYFIQLHHKIKVIGNPNLDEELSGLTESNVDKIQLFDCSINIDWEDYLDEEVRLTRSEEPHV